MRIGIDARFLTHPQRGGFKTYTMNLVSALANIDHQNQYVIYIDRSPPDDLILPDQSNFETRVIRGDLPYLGMIWREQVGLAYQARADRLDVLHSPCLTSPMVLGCHSVVTIHDLIWMNPHAKNGKSAKRLMMEKYFQYIASYSLKRASMIVTVSNYSKESILRSFNVHESKIITAYEAANPIFHVLFDNHQVECVREKYQLPPNYILVLGSADPRKNIQTAFKAYGLLPDEVQEKFSLAVVCSNHFLKDEFHNHTTDLGLHKNIHLLTGVSDSDLVALYNGASIFLFPSRAEGFGLPLLEAMACGVPCIASNNSSIPEVAGDAAILISDCEDAQEFADAMLYVIVNRRFREELIDQGICQAAKFSWDLCATQTISSYEMAMANGKSNRR